MDDTAVDCYCCFSCCHVLFSFGLKSWEWNWANWEWFCRGWIYWFVPMANNVIVVSFMTKDVVFFFLSYAASRFNHKFNLMWNNKDSCKDRGSSFWTSLRASSHHMNGELSAVDGSDKIYDGRSLRRGIICVMIYNNHREREIAAWFPTEHSSYCQPNAQVAFDIGAAGQISTSNMQCMYADFWHGPEWCRQERRPHQIRTSVIETGAYAHI